MRADCWVEGRKPSWYSGSTRSVESFFRWCVLSTAWVGVLLGFALLLRRGSGAWTRPLDIGPLLLCGLALVGVTWLLRSALAAVSVAGRPPWHDLSWWLPGLALVAVGLAVSLPGTSGLPFFWMLLVGEEAVSLWRATRRGTREEVSTTVVTNHHDPPDAPLQTGRGLSSEVVPRVTLDDIDQGNIGKDVWQHVTRIREPSGRETLVGLLRGEASVGQQTLRLHVAFCPPFVTVPEFHVQQLEGPEAELDVGEVMTYGTRIDVRLARPCETPQKVLVQLMVETEEPEPSDSGILEV